MIPRSTLFTPGDAPAMLAKALDGDADAVTFDLEDGVAPDAKSEARRAVAGALADAPPDRTVGVRINPPGEGAEADVEAVLGGREPDYLVVPKVERPRTLERLAEHLDGHGTDVPLRATVETATGVLEAPAIAAAPRVGGLGFGGEDLSADLGAAPTPGGAELDYARQRVVVAAAAAGIPALDTVYADVEDPEGLRTEAERAARLGFDGKSAIHPAQVRIINEAFTPGEAAIERALRVVEAFEAADAGAVRVDGEMVDPPVYERARRVLDRARAAGLID